MKKELLRKIVLLSSLLALAFALSYVDFLIPFDAVGIPGVKLGLANLAVLAALYWLGWSEAILVSFSRMLLAWLFFGNVVSFLYSLCGGVLSLAAMALLSRFRVFDELGVSVCGAVLHNTGQILFARFLTKTNLIWRYYPILIVSAVLTGAFIGGLFRLVNGRLAGKIPWIPREKE